MDPHQVHKSQVALLALPYYILGSSQYSTAQVALALPCHFHKPSQLEHFQLHQDSQRCLVPYLDSLVLAKIHS